MKIKSFGNGKIIRMLKNYNGISFDSSHPITRQIISIFPKKKSFIFRSMDRYVKLFENVELTNPKSENIIPRRLSIKKRLGRRKSSI